MKLELYHVDAFTDKIFCGNPAAVCLLPEWLSDYHLNAIAKENNLPATVFLVRINDDFEIRWVTPEYELDLCGHGSLAAAYVIFNYLNKGRKEIKLKSRIEVISIVRNDDYFTLNFPAKEIEKCSFPLLDQGLGVSPKEAYQHKNERCMAVFSTEEEVIQLRPDIAILKKLPHLGVTVTAPGKNVDFVSRTFYPKKTISEDPATGASHCLLVPYWVNRLNKHEFQARQVSARGGDILCRYQNNRVLISGKAVLYMQGTLTINNSI